MKNSSNKIWHYSFSVIVTFFSIYGVYHSIDNYKKFEEWVVEKFKTEESIEEDNYFKIEEDVKDFFDRCNYPSQLNLDSSFNPSIDELMISIGSLNEDYNFKLKMELKKYLLRKYHYYKYHLNCSNNYLTIGKYEARKLSNLSRPNLAWSIEDFENLDAEFSIEDQIQGFEAEEFVYKPLNDQKDSLENRQNYIHHDIMENRAVLMKHLLLEYELIYKWYYFKLFNEKLNFNEV